ncbi:MAG: hypothetical protein ACRDSH_24025 [Pseudonocardiaceae bacterium]
MWCQRQVWHRPRTRGAPQIPRPGVRGAYQPPGARAAMNNNRRVISATCAIHPGAAGYCNLEVSRDGDDLMLNPHVTGACQVLLTLTQARELYAAIGELL